MLPSAQQMGGGWPLPNALSRRSTSEMVGPPDRHRSFYLGLREFRDARSGRPGLRSVFTLGL